MRLNALTPKHALDLLLYIPAYVLVSTIVGEMPIMHHGVGSAGERHFNYVCFSANEAWGRGKEEVAWKKWGKQGDKENYVKCFDMNSGPLLFLLLPLCTLLSIWGIRANWMWLQPGVLRWGERPQTEEKSETSERCKLLRFLAHRPDAPAKSWDNYLSPGVCSSRVAPLLICSTYIYFIYRDSDGCYGAKVGDLS